ncbi:MAG: DUF1573 domain-containing protein [Kiritimatiellia bacterium]|jgi:hypothetical protein|nr:DUF1573 domain-containing protein [Kiritimatiellia bacterium]MDP6631131.1 DUF1573 domain-containing protein [Kiritimatiellia bacterium]MDP6810088.1 DUF1573 domain-containing protein [Kiritimatiellia bacterium]MDP7024859.1 DUF1573 domain-containing protein [Kiritimatiellia bacterium]
MHRSVYCFALSLLLYSHAQAAPKIVCAAPEFNFGVRNDHETVFHEFVVKNSGDSPLAISRVKASCGCTAVKSGANSLQPGQTTTIEARFTLKGRRGKQQKSITVESNDPATPRLRLWLKGEITVEVAVEPRYLNFRQIHKDSVVTQNVTLVSLRPDVRITGVRSDSTSFAATIDPDGRGLTVRTVPPVKDGLLRGRMTVTTDHPRGLSTYLNIAGVAVGDLLALPRDLLLRKSSTAPRRITIVVRPFIKQPFEVTTVEVPLPTIKTSVTKQPDGSYRVLLDNVSPAPELAGKAILIHTSLESTPELRVPIRVLP